MSASTSPTATPSQFIPPKGVTAETTHAVLSETATRALSYVAMSRGRDVNTAYLYQRSTEYEYQHGAPDAAHVMRRGSNQHAGRLFRAIVANDERLLTALGIAATTGDEGLSSRVRGAGDTFEHAMREADDRGIGLDRSRDDGLEL